MSCAHQEPPCPILILRVAEPGARSFRPVCVPSTLRRGDKALEGSVGFDWSPAPSCNLLRLKPPPTPSPALPECLECSCLIPGEGLPGAALRTAGGVEWGVRWPNGAGEWGCRRTWASLACSLPYAARSGSAENMKEAGGTVSGDPPQRGQAGRAPVQAGLGTVLSSGATLRGRCQATRTLP